MQKKIFFMVGQWLKQIPLNSKKSIVNHKKKTSSNLQENVRSKFPQLMLCIFRRSMLITFGNIQDISFLEDIQYYYQVVIYLFKFNQRNTKAIYEISSKLAIKTLEWSHWRSGIFMAVFAYISQNCSVSNANFEQVNDCWVEKLISLS